MVSYSLRSRLQEELPPTLAEKLAAILTRLIKRAPPAAPMKPLAQMNAAELDRVSDI